MCAMQKVKPNSLKERTNGRSSAHPLSLLPRTAKTSFPGLSSYRISGFEISPAWNTASHSSITARTSGRRRLCVSEITAILCNSARSISSSLSTNPLLQQRIPSVLCVHVHPGIPAIRKNLHPLIHPPYHGQVPLSFAERRKAPSPPSIKRIAERALPVKDYSPQVTSSHSPSSVRASHHW